MGITDELREWANGNSLRAGMSLRVACNQALAIADRIEAEHQKAIRELNNLADNSVLLPVDADGVPIRVGDHLCSSFYEDGTVSGIELMQSRNEQVWAIAVTPDGWDVASWHNPESYSHHQPDTWERIIKDAMSASESDELSSGSYEQAVTALVARCKALAGDAE